MNAREERGLVIAATCRLNRLSDDTWLVPSQTKAGDVAAYHVNLNTKACTCPDHVEGGFTCKHYYAASIVHQREVLPDGTVIEQQQFAFTEKRTTYKQDWPAYNIAQSTEKRRFRVLLTDLCRKAPDYLPGLLERALLHIRNGERSAATQLMRQVLKRAASLPADELVAGPEPLPAGFYSTSAEAFLRRQNATP